MAELAPFIRSPGYICALEGLVACSGAPLVYVQGLPHGSKDEIVSQIMYVHERCLQSCIANNELLQPPLTLQNAQGVPKPRLRKTRVRVHCMHVHVTDIDGIDR